MEGKGITGSMTACGFEVVEPGAETGVVANVESETGRNDSVDAVLESVFVGGGTTKDGVALGIGGRTTGVFVCDLGIGVAGVVTPLTNTGVGFELRSTDLQLPENHRLSVGILRLPVPCVLDDPVRSRVSTKASHRTNKFP